ncbi:GAP family protein [Gordonia sp. (in: high G+C Gram-positive bacteria)]|uniref:GAP family protein n=1 Tax=Gordonia sp. (in: high G+C Gram-positive bacteria) TaxID=84139 RepID=UPI0039E21470
MLSAIGTTIPLAIAITFSPFPIVAVILTLLSPHPERSGSAFAVGWLVGLTAVMTIVLVAARVFGASQSGSDGGTDAHPHHLANGIVHLVIGAALLVWAYLQWRQRPKPGETPEEPRWLTLVNGMGPAKCAGLGLVLSALNPKEVVVTIAAAYTLARTSLSSAELVVPAAVFVLLASALVIAPLVAFSLHPDRSTKALESAKQRLIANNALIMTIVLAISGAIILGRGLELV